MDTSAPFRSSAALPQPAAVLQLFKPITWFPPMWAFACGVVSAGQPLGDHVAMVALGVLLAGPMICATSQAVNDWFDRHVDAINEPRRPIPSGRIPGRWGLYIAVLWTILSMLLASFMGPVVFVAALVGLALAWLYSAPPARLKANGWWGNSACGLCYETLPWITGAAAALGGLLPDPRLLAIALLYGIGAHGIMTLNDFKALSGDRAMGIRSLPVQLGPKRAALLACGVMAVPQAIVVTLLLAWGAPVYAALVAVVLAVQLVLMRRLLSDPRRFAPWYNATGISLYVTGMMLSAVALRSVVAA
jgi:chlorophyll/bacteriochlorophyll a synthase